MLRKLALGAIPVAAAFASVPASAAAPTTCVGYATTVITGWTECAGFYDKNVFSNSDADVAKQQEAVAFLGGSFGGNFDTLFGFGNLSNNSSGARTIDFGQTFYGVNIIGVHFGNIGEPKDTYGNVSAFYKLNFGTTGASQVDFVQSRGLSSLHVYSVAAAVPEAATWALFILGFGGIGGALRRRNSQVKAAKAMVTYA